MPPLRLRMTSAVWICLISWVILAGLLAEPIIRGQWLTVLRYGPGVVLAGWLAYIFFWAPQVVVKQHRLEVQNVWTTTEIPYRLIDDVSVRGLVKVTYTEGNKTRHLTSWNAPGTPAMSRAFTGRAHVERYLGTSDPGMSPAEALFGPSHAIVDAWHNAAPDSGPDTVSVRRHYITMVITALLVAATIGAQLTG